MRVETRPSSQSSSGWFNILPPEASGQTLQGEHVANWVIIGGGVTGLSTARQLAEHLPEARILLIDAQQIGMGASGQNAGFIIDIPQLMGKDDNSSDEAFQKTREFNIAAIEHLRNLVQTHDIDCQWSERGKIHAAAEEFNMRALESYRDRLERLGVPYDLLEKSDLEQQLGTSFYRTGIRTKECVLIQPAALVRGLARTLPANVEVYEGSPITNISYGNKVSITCQTGSVIADNVILATNAFTKSFGFLNSRIGSVYLTGSLTRVLTEEEQAVLGDIKDWGVLSAHRMGATVRYTKDRRIFIRNTVEFRPNPVVAKNNMEHYRSIHMDGLRRRFPMLPELEFEHSWGGFACVTRNKTTIFGQLEKNVYASICYNASGIGKGSIFGKLLADKIVGATSQQLSAVESLAPASRFPPSPLLDIGAHVSMANLRRNLGQDI